MSKELEVLESWKEIKDYLNYVFYGIGECKAVQYTSTSLFLEPHMNKVENALKNYQELLKIDCKQNTINDFYPNTKSMIDDLLNLMCIKICDFLKEGETYTKTRMLEILGTAVKYVKTFAYGKEFNETEKVGVNEKKLKAFDIIKEKRVDMNSFIRDFVEGTDTYNEYYEDIDEYHYYRKGDYETPILTQQELDLLKEVLL